MKPNRNPWARVPSLIRRHVLLTSIGARHPRCNSVDSLNAEFCPPREKKKQASMRMRMHPAHLHFCCFSHFVLSPPLSSRYLIRPSPPHLFQIFKFVGVGVVSCVAEFILSPSFSRLVLSSSLVLPILSSIRVTKRTSRQCMAGQDTWDSLRVGTGKLIPALPREANSKKRGCK